MLYKTIKAKRIYHHLFDVDTGIAYDIVNHGMCGNYGYFMIKSCGDNKWQLVRQVKKTDIRAEEFIYSLPLFNKIALYNFFGQNYSDTILAQKYFSIITF